MKSSNDVGPRAQSPCRMYASQIVGVASEEQIPACEHSHHNHSVDDVLAAIPRQHGSGGAGLGLAQRLDATIPARDARVVPGDPKPRLGERERGGTNAALQQPAVQCPDRQGASFGCDQRTSVVGDAAHAVVPGSHRVCTRATSPDCSTPRGRSPSRHLAARGPRAPHRQLTTPLLPPPGFSLRAPNRMSFGVVGGR